MDWFGNFHASLTEQGWSVAGAVLTVLCAWGFWRVRRSVQRDRERSMEMLNLYEIYAHIRYAVRLLEEEGWQDAEQRIRVRTARDGLIQSCTLLTTAFKVVHQFPVNHSTSLIQIAEEHLARGNIFWAETCYELGYRVLCYDFSDPESRQREQREEFQACLVGLQECATERTDRQQSLRWGREAQERGLEVPHGPGEIRGPGFELRSWTSRLRSRLRRLRNSGRIRGGRSPRNV